MNFDKLGNTKQRLASNIIESNQTIRRLCEDEKDPREIIKAQKLMMKNNQTLKKLRGENK